MTAQAARVEQMPEIVAKWFATDGDAPYQFMVDLIEGWFPDDRDGDAAATAYQALSEEIEIAIADAPVSDLERRRALEWLENTGSFIACERLVDAYWDDLSQDDQNSVWWFVEGFELDDFREMANERRRTV